MLVQETHLGGFTGAVHAFEHNQQAAAEAAWETHTAEDRKQTTESTVHPILAIVRAAMAYCCISLCRCQGLGVEGESIVRQEGTRMATHLRITCLSSWFVCVLLVCIAATNAWSDTDKTIVDL